MRNRNGYTVVFRAIVVIVALCTLGAWIGYLNTLVPGIAVQTPKVEQQTDSEHSVSVPPLTDTPANSEHVVSVAPLTATTEVTAAGWKTAEVTLDGKKFRVFYQRMETRKFDWGSKQQTDAIYNFKDEATARGVSPGDYGFVVYVGSFEGTFIASKARLDQAHHRPDSPLQEIILKNPEEAGKKIFRQIFDQLEVIEGPKK